MSCNLFCVSLKQILTWKLIVSISKHKIAYNAK
jgi:hypothetical protein